MIWLKEMRYEALQCLSKCRLHHPAPVRDSLALRPGVRVEILSRKSHLPHSHRHATLHRQHRQLPLLRLHQGTVREFQCNWRCTNIELFLLALHQTIFHHFILILTECCQPDIRAAVLALLRCEAAGSGQQDFFTNSNSGATTVHTTRRTTASTP